MTKRINILIGRFQPFTKGHMKCVEYVYRNFDLPTMIVMIDTPDNKVDEKHPFPSSMLLPMYNDLFKARNDIEGVILSKNANIVEIGEKLFDMGYEVASWVCGTDRYDSYKKMSDRYKDKAHLADDFQMIEIVRSDEDISATKVREALLNGDYKTFSKLMPYIPLNIHLKYKPYESLKKQLEKVIL